jgi:hypothetical protein
MANNTNHQLNLTGSYRNFKIDNSSIITSKTEQTILGRLQYDGSIWKRTLSFASLYEFGSGQEQKRAFTYIQVPAGQGMYNWIDYNADGVQQLNEFVVALYPDQKLFIKIYTPSDEYVKVNNVSFNQSINFEPSNLFQNKKTSIWRSICSKSSDQFAIQVVNKILNTAGLNAFDPIIQSYNDSAILIANTAINNSFYYNRSSSHWGLDYNYTNNKSQQLLTYGLNAIKNQQHLVKIRSAISKTVTINLSGKIGTRSNRSGIDDGSSYLQNYWSGEPALIWLNHSVLRITTSLKIEERKNSMEYGGEIAKIQSANIEARYSQTSTGIIQMRFTLSNITYSGLNSSPITYSMLDGLKAGNNFLWYLNWQRKLGKGIELYIEYEGRKAGDQRIINTGRMSLRAIL